MLLSFFLLVSHLKTCTLIQTHIHKHINSFHNNNFHGLEIIYKVLSLRMKQRRYIEDEEALANSGAFTLSNPLVAVKDEGVYHKALYMQLA